MMRILFDELGGSHNDIILKIDTSPNFMQVADTYYLYEFLDIKADEKIDVIIGFINYFKNEILSLNDETRFIAFDLSDQYVGGIFVSESKKGLVKVEYGFSKKIAGYGTNKDTIANQVAVYIESFEIEYEWEISKNSIIEGLDWSLKKNMKMKNGEKRKNELKLSELLENVPSKVYFNDVVEKEKLDERISGVDCIFINIIGINSTNIDFLPNDNPPKLNEVLAWIWVFSPDLMEEILKYNINPEFLRLIESYKSGDMEQYWKSLME